jgi:similar to stage IV sporulation protein
MLLLKIWNYVRGYVIIMVEGYFLEKFVNICIRRQILLWDIKKLKDSRMTLNVSIKGFRMLRPVAKKTHCRVSIAEKRGIPFILSRYKGRKTFFLGAVVFIILFILMTSFIWTIEVAGNQTIETELILNKLMEMGIKPGVLKFRINTENVSNNIIMDIHELSWVSVVVKGTKVKVEVSEAVKRPPIVPRNIPCDVVAAKDGVIKSIIVTAGIENVKAGDTVKKGQILISGTVPVKNQEDNPRMVHAMGVVNARTWYENEQLVETRVVEKVRTGNKKDNISILLFSKRIGLFNKDVPYSDYDRVEMRKLFSIGEDMVLPFGFITERYYEYSIIEAEITLEDAKKSATDTAYREVLKRVPEEAEIVNKILSFVENEDGSLSADVIIECIEDIGYTIEIGGK